VQPQQGVTWGLVSLVEQAAEHFPQTPVKVAALEPCFANGNVSKHGSTRRAVPAAARLSEPRADLRKLKSVRFSAEEVLSARFDAGVDLRLPSVKPWLQAAAAYAMLSVCLGYPACPFRHDSRFI
jgi:hypothetical protein